LIRYQHFDQKDRAAARQTIHSFLCLGELNVHANFRGTDYYSWCRYQSMYINEGDTLDTTKQIMEDCIRLVEDVETRLKRGTIQRYNITEQYDASDSYGNGYSSDLSEFNAHWSLFYSVLADALNMFGSEIVGWLERFYINPTVGSTVLFTVVTHCKHIYSPRKKNP
jgi:hypothetical protein